MYRRPGFLSIRREILDITNETQFRNLFCPNSVDIFFSEHTLEHVTYDGVRTAFLNFYKYLRPGGRVRLAVPDCPGNYTPTQEDIEFKHLSYWNHSNIVEVMSQTGFSQITLLEYIDTKTTPWVYRTSAWDRCLGYVTRSAKYDRRNVDWHKRHPRETVVLDQFYELGNNTFLLNDLPNKTSLIAECWKL